jgi:hypothetical protein
MRHDGTTSANMFGQDCHFEVKEQSPTARVPKLKTTLEVRSIQLHDDLLAVSFVRRLYRHGEVLLRVDLLNLAT